MQTGDTFHARCVRVLCKWNIDSGNEGESATALKTRLAVRSPGVAPKLSQGCRSQGLAKVDARRYMSPLPARL